MHLNNSNSVRFSVATAAALMLLFVGGAFAHPDLDVHPRSIENALRNFELRDTMWVDNEAGDAELVWELEIQGDSLEWISAEPRSGRLGAGQGQIVVVRQNGRDLDAGHYYALLHYTSNDPTRDAFDVPVAGHTIEYPRIEATWAVPGQGEWWGLDMDRIVGRMEWGGQYGFDLNIINRGSARLDCDTILCNNAYFTFVPGVFSLDPGANRAVRVTLNAQEVGGNAGTITSISNAWDPRELNFRITATVDSAFRRGGSLQDVAFNEDSPEVAIADLDTIFISSAAGARIDVIAGYALLYRIARNGELLLRGRPNWNGNQELVVSATLGDSVLSDTCMITVNAVADPPDPFDLIAPEDGDTLYFDGGDSLLIWQNTIDPDRDTVRFTLHIYQAEGLDTTIRDLTDTTFAIRDLYYRDDLAGEIHWEVSATGGGEVRNAWSIFGFFLMEGRQAVQQEIPPSDWNVLQAYPNPFNAGVTISFKTPMPGKMAAVIYDLQGNQLETLFNGDLRAGEHHFTWNSVGFASGIYIVKAEIAGNSFTRKIVLVK